MSQHPHHHHHSHHHSQYGYQQQQHQQHPQQPEISPEDLRYIAHTQRALAQGGSPASSRSSNASQAALSLDPTALARLSSHFDVVLEGITERVEMLSNQTLRSTQGHHRRAGQVVQRAEEEMERLREIIQQCDELQDEFLKIRRIGEIVKGFRRRVESLEGRVGR